MLFGEQLLLQQAATIYIKKIGSFWGKKNKKKTNIRLFDGEGS